MATDDYKKLSDLRVVDLRAELEKRGLDKTGVKANLIERLEKALVAEGENPDEYQFESNEKKHVKRLSTSQRSEEANESYDQSGAENSVTNDTHFSDTTMVEEIKVSENEIKKSGTIAESPSPSPLNLLIGEEEENLLLNANEENLQSVDSQKRSDAKTSASNMGSTTVNTREVGNTAAKDEHDEGKQDAEAEDAKQAEEEEEAVKREGGDDADEAVGGSNDTNPKQSESATVAASAAENPTSSSFNTVPEPSSEKEPPKNDKDKNKTSKSNPGRSLWVTNLLPSTRAQELKHLLSRYGKVIGAKVVQSSRYPRTKCYGYVTMETRAAADHCIEKLNNTELKGQIIRVAKVRPEHSLPVKSQKKDFPDNDKSKKKTPPKQTKSSTSERSLDKTKEPISDKKKEEKIKKDPKEGERSRRSGSRKSKTSSRPERKSDILTFEKIREERERQRQRDRERALREEEKRRREIQRSREIEKHQREESQRLEREREKLRMERDRLERQRSEIMRLERERQKLEREKLEQEKQELRRQQMRLEEVRRPVKRPSSSSSSSFRRESGTYTDDRKRIVTERHYEETPPPPRFEVTSRETANEIPTKKELAKDYKSRITYSERTKDYSKHSSDFKREYPQVERHSGGHPSHIVHAINNSGNSKYVSSYVNRDREREIRVESSRREAIVPSVPPPRISKEGRYSERSPVEYRSVREERERRTVSDHHAKSDLRPREHRYAESTPIKEGTRYRESNSWHSTPAKQFGGMSGSATSRESWSKSESWRPMESNSSERWSNSSSRLVMSNPSGISSAMYSGGNTMSSMGGMSCPPPPGNSNYSMDRFDNYKSISSSRKY